MNYHTFHFYFWPLMLLLVSLFWLLLIWIGFGNLFNLLIYTESICYLFILLHSCDTYKRGEFKSFYGRLFLFYIFISFILLSKYLRLFFLLKIISLRQLDYGSVYFKSTSLLYILSFLINLYSGMVTKFSTDSNLIYLYFKIPCKY